MLSLIKQVETEAAYSISTCNLACSLHELSSRVKLSILRFELASCKPDLFALWIGFESFFKDASSLWNVAS